MSDALTTGAERLAGVLATDAIEIDETQGVIASDPGLKALVEFAQKCDERFWQLGIGGRDTARVALRKWEHGDE